MQALQIFSRKSILLLLLALLLLAACSDDGDAPPTPINAPAAIIPLTVWTVQTSPEAAIALQQQVDAFIAATPGISVTVKAVADYPETLRAALTVASPAGTGSTVASAPDLFLLDATQFRPLRAADALAPLQNSLSAVEDFHPALVQAFGENGVLWCAPREASTLALVYNQTLLTAAAVALPDVSWDWNTLFAAAEQTTDLAQGIFGFVLPADVTRWLPFVHAAGGSLPLDGTATTNFAMPAVEQALAYYTSFGAQDFSAEAIDVDSTWPGEAFGRQRAAMAIEGVWIVPWMQKNFPPTLQIPMHADLPGVAVGYAELPAGPAGRATTLFANCYGVNARSPNLDAAARLADFLTSGDRARLWANVNGWIPARQSITSEVVAANPAYQPFVAGLAYAVPWQADASMDPVIAALNEGIHRLFYEETTPAEVLTAADTLYQEIIP